VLPPNLTRAGYGITAFVSLGSGAMLPFLDRSSSEFFLMSFTLVLGLVFGFGVWFFSRRRPPQ
jgi:hypothetical protein